MFGRIRTSYRCDPQISYRNSSILERCAHHEGTTIRLGDDDLGGRSDFTDMWPQLGSL